jgi:hypothetical protein
MAEVNNVKDSIPEYIGGIGTKNLIDSIHNNNGVFLKISIYIVAILPNSPFEKFFNTASIVPKTILRIIDTRAIVNVNFIPCNKNTKLA